MDPAKNLENFKRLDHQGQWWIPSVRTYDDLLKYPFNEEIKGIGQRFTLLLKSIIETIDQCGLKTKFLRGHKPSVENFYEQLSSCDYKTDVAIYYQERFNKNRNKLFTFLDYDDVPWNNNNAEHTIKAFAKLRRILEHETEDKGINDEFSFLISLLSMCSEISILSQTDYLVD